VNTIENDKAAKLKALRLRAEQLIRESPGEFKDTPAEDIQSVIHELQVYQIELEMQNEELRRTKVRCRVESIEKVHKIKNSPPQQSTVKLRKRLFIYSASVLLLVMVLISFALSETMFRYMKNREADSLVDIAIMRSLGVSQWRKRAEDLAKQVTSRSRIRQELEKYNLGEIDLQQLESFTKPKLQDAVNLSTEIIDILRLDARGQVVTGCGFESEEFLKNYNVSGFVHKKTTLSEPLRINNRTLIIASAPNINRADEYQGADLVFLDLEHLKKVATNPDKIGKTGLVTVGYKSENSIRPLFPPQSQRKHNSNSFELVKTFLSLAIDGKSGVESIGRIKLIYQSIDNCNWGLVVTQNTDELYLPIYAQMKIIIYLSIAIYFISLVGFWLLIKPLAGKILLHTSELERRIQERTEGLEREVDQHKRSKTTLQKSEEKFRAMIETSPDGIGITSLDGKVQYVSPQILAMWGYEHESEMIGKSMTDLFRSDYHEKAAQSIGGMFSGKFIGAEEYVMIRKDGSEVFGEANANLIYNEKDEPVSIIFINRDITERRQAQDALRESEERFNLAITGTGAGLWDWDMVNDTVYFSPQWKAMLGYEDHEIENAFSGWKKLWHPDDVTRIEEALKDYLDEKTTKYEIEHRLRHKDGDWRWILTRGDIIKDHDGKPSRWVGTNLDVTERKLIEKTLQESEEKYGIIFDQSPVAIEFYDALGGLIIVNEACLELFGVVDKNEISGFKLFEDPNISGEIKAELLKNRSVRFEGEFNFEEVKRLKLYQTTCSGIKILDWSITPLIVDDLLIGYVLQIRNITSRKQAEQKLKTSEKQFRQISENTPAIVYQFKMSHDKSFSFPYVSEKILGLMGVSAQEVMRDASNLINLVHPEDLEMFVENVMISASNLTPYHDIFRCVKGETTVWVECRTTPTPMADGSILWDGFFLDISERKQAEEKIKSSLKEKEILLSEIHHRVKNNMQVISSLLKLQSAKIEDKKYVDMFKDSENRIKAMSLIHETLYQSKDFANIDFNGYVKTIANALIRSYAVNADRIKLHTEIENIPVELDHAIPCGLIINELISNALKYAFPKDEGGTIKITFRSTNDDEVELTVSDDGIGIPEEIDIGKTESLGLQLVHILAEDQLEGTLELQRDRGTAFKVRFKNW